ncbi:uncharacterized protein LOC111452257 isoform X2 [Cucurbita moschata]|uniref:Uncharacterized protein LOC111452257 isoform X2 n=1 Tax=Cucurbita moschata TaxID=3662 RepID=A0A6J1G9V1_CUCMO|nr:uncharacterized protein LOC111452257 isoform X2 [Cucurbita moschata]
MEGKSNGYQTSSFVADLFDVEESPLSSASGVLAAMFPSPQKVGSRTSSSGDWLKQTNGNQPRHTKQGNSDLIISRRELGALSSEFISILWRTRWILRGPIRWTIPTPTVHCEYSLFD